MRYRAVKRQLKATAISVALMSNCAGLSANQETEETAAPKPYHQQSKYALGIQLAPLVTGLSLKYNPVEDWALQGAITLRGGDPYFAVRAAKSIDASEFWNNYVYVGAAHNSDTDSSYDDNLGASTTVEEDHTAITIGLGAEWSWRAKNVNRPPFYYSLDFGLAYKTEKKVDRTKKKNRMSIAVGWGLHYHF